MAEILVVDDEQAICWGFEKLCRGMGHSVRTAPSAERGLQLAAELAPDALVLDVRLPGMDGLAAMEQFRQLSQAPIIVVTAFGDMRTAVTALKNGAFEYLLKPFDLDSARLAIRRALHSRESLASAPDADQEMVGDSPIMQALYRQIALAADSQANVLLRGESGTGKELAARAIHRHSPVSDGPFVAVNVAALSGSVAESELFGHVDGAFTGASSSRLGLLQRASGGTLFLDEVAEIPLAIQAKLLRAIEEQEVLPVGADELEATRFRVVSATHQDLAQLVQAGTFRRDLFYRLCAFEIALPSLRDRPDDIAGLAAYFAAEIGDTHGPFAEETLEELRRRPWRGNVRELRNAVEHALVLARSGPILPEHLPVPQPRLEGGHTAEQSGHDSALAAVVRHRIEQLLDDPAADGSVYETLLGEIDRATLPAVLERFGNEFAPAARALGLHRTTLKKKVQAPTPPPPKPRRADRHGVDSSDTPG